MGLLDWLSPKPPPDPPTLARIEHAVKTIDPLIRQVSSYEHILAPAVKKAYGYCEDLALAIPGPIEISRAAFARDPLIHAFFGSADDVSTMLATSQCVRDYLNNATTPSHDQCCALLGMRRRITAGFGTRITGEVIHRDEPQKTLTFADHTLAEPSPDLDSAHRHLAERMFDGLLKGFLAHVDEVREERQELRGASAIDLRFLGPNNTLVKTLALHLSAPESSLSLEPVRLWVDRVGILIEDRNERAQADDLRMVELTTRDLRRWVVLVVKINRDEARAAIEQFDARRRYIVI